MPTSWSERLELARIAGLVGSMNLARKSYADSAIDVGDCYAPDLNVLKTTLVIQQGNTGTN